MSLSRRDFLISGVGSLAAASPLGKLAFGQSSDEAVIVIGAGIAGIAAARELKNKFRSVTILEARDRIGGRIWTYFTGDQPVDLGASWLHDSIRNPLVPIAKKLGLPEKATDWQNRAFYNLEGQVMDPKEIAAVKAMVRGALHQIYKKADKRPLGLSLREAIDQETLAKKHPQITQWVIATQVTLYNEELERVSPHMLVNDLDFVGADLLLPEHGLGGLVQAMSRGLDIRLNQRVQSINSSGPKVKIRTCRGDFTADKIIITLPLGVLKNEDVVFTPALPSEKLGAIRRLGMGCVNKVCLTFEKAWWPQGHDTYGSIGSEFPIFLDLNVSSGKPVLIAHIAGDAGRALEMRSDAENVSRVLGTLSGMFKKTVPEPIAAVVTHWHSDPFARGSYSVGAVGGEITDRGTLAKSVDRKLFFAGEAVHKTTSATVHGAYLTGLAAAGEVMRAAKDA